MCKTKYKKRGTEPPCKECLPPLLEANQEALKVYLACRGQYVMGGMGPVDINHLAVHACMDLYGVHDRVGCFEKVCAVATHEIGRMIEKREAEREK